jgi:CRISPR type I-E-associated protein CasB/Cse2
VSESASVAPDTGTTATRLPDRGARAFAWWKRLIDPDRGDPGSLARLRRARSTLEALNVPAGASLARRLGAAHADAPDWRTRDTLDLARLLAHVKEHDAANRPMQAAGWKKFAGDKRESEAGDDRPRLSEARFRRLYETGDGEEKVAAFTRLVALMDGVVKVDALANDFLLWNHPDVGDRVRERWAFDYYHAWTAAPTTPITDPDSDPTTDDEDEG